jgi:hypothetical protein
LNEDRKFSVISSSVSKPEMNQISTLLTDAGLR